MAAKVVFFIVSTVLVQNAYSQCLNSLTGFNGLGLSGINGLGYSGLAFEAEAVSSGIGALNGYYNNGYNVLNNGVALSNVGYGNLGVLGTGLGVNSLGLYGNNVLGLGYNGIIPDLVGYPSLGNIGSSGPLAVSTISPIGPSGLAVASENEIAGTLLASGTLPFLSAVSFEGALPTAGSGVATCGCGNGAVGIVSDGFPGPYPGPFPTALPGYATIGTGIGGIYY